MKHISHFPSKVKLLLELEYPLIEKLLPRKGFIGGRIGYNKGVVFKWLLVKSNQLGIPNNHGTFRYFSSNIYSEKSRFSYAKSLSKIFPRTRQKRLT